MPCRGTKKAGGNSDSAGVVSIEVKRKPREIRRLYDQLSLLYSFSHFHLDKTARLLHVLRGEIINTSPDSPRLRKLDQFKSNYEVHKAETNALIDHVAGTKPARQVAVMLFTFLFLC